MVHDYKTIQSDHRDASWQPSDQFSHCLHEILIGVPLCSCISFLLIYILNRKAANVSTVSDPQNKCCIRCQWFTFFKEELQTFPLFQIQKNKCCFSFPLNQILIRFRWIRFSEQTLQTFPLNPILKTNAAFRFRRIRFSEQMLYTFPLNQILRTNAANVSTTSDSQNKCFIRFQ